MHNCEVISRELGVFEKACNSIRDTVTTIAEITGHNFDLKILKKALDSVVALQPNLRINIDESSEPFQFREIDNPYIEPILVESDDPDEWKRIAFFTMNDRFTPSLNSPAFKLTILKMKNESMCKTYLFVQLYHVISDGFSGMIALNNILSFYSKFAGGEVREFKPVEFLPSSEELCFPNGVSEEDSVAVDKIIENLKANKKKDKTLVKPCKIENEENIHYAIFEDGTEENFKNLRSFSKREGVTFGNIIMAAYYFATARIGYEHLKDDTTIALPVAVNINLRDRLEKQLGREHIAMMYSIGKIYMEFSKDTTFIELTRKIQVKMNSYFKERTLYHDIEVNTIITEELDKKNPSFEEIISPYLNTDMNLSNTGAYPFDPIYRLREGEIHLKSLKCVGSPWTPLYSHYYLGIHSVNYMNYSLVFCDRKNIEYAKDYMSSIINLIEKCYNFENMTFGEYLERNE